MARFVGIDAHKKILQYCILDADGTRLEEGSATVTKPELERFARETLTVEDEIVLEATSNTWAIVDLLEPQVQRVVVSNPMKTRAIASAKIKTDRIDARILAELLRCRFLPEVWQPDPDTRRKRTLTHRRAGLVRDQTRIKNRLHAVLAQRLIPVPMGRLFSAKGFAWLSELELDADGRSMLDSDLRLLEKVIDEIEQVDRQIAELAYPDENVRLLMTLPGISVTVAQGLVAAWGPIDRFPDAGRAASYLGLVPSIRQSAARSHHGRITKQGNSHARWLLIQAAQHLDKDLGPLGAFFRRLKAKKNRNIAVVAAARKMATVAWHMLKNNEPYRYASPRATQNKLATLRIRAGGGRRRGGAEKGTPRPESYGSGRQLRKIPSLAEVCDKETLSLPVDVNALPPGEKRMLQETRTLEHAQAVHETRYVPKRRGGMPRMPPAGKETKTSSQTQPTKQ